MRRFHSAKVSRKDIAVLVRLSTGAKWALLSKTTHSARRMPATKGLTSVAVISSYRPDVTSRAGRGSQAVR
jgi:hypothetical protein